MRRTVALIIGTPYSGSSILNLLLDSQSKIRGLGEAVNLLSWPPSAPCSQCGEQVECCPLYMASDRSNFYGSLFHFYDDACVLVDSSKDFSWCFRARSFEPTFIYKTVLLSKSPHEFMSSWLGHHPDESPHIVMGRYLDFYERQIDWLWNQAWFTPDAFRAITYRQLANRPDDTLQALCDFLQVPYRCNPAWWRSESHIIGGNRMVATQIHQARNGSVDQSRLTGKYRGQFRTIFYDSLWRADRDQQRICVRLYEEFQSRLEPVLEALRQPDCLQLTSEVVRCF